MKSGEQGRLLSAEGHAPREIKRLGTLGDSSGDLTCSMHVARVWGRAEQIEPHSSFENAGLALKDGRVDAILVPGAYPRLGEFIMDAELAANETFVMRIPALVLAMKSGSATEHVAHLFHHPATASLLSETGLRWALAVPVSSNVEACRRLLDEDSAVACITNLLCAQHFGLAIVKTLRSGVLMPWICFGRTIDPA